ncbi:MAG: putative Fe-S cluster assembly protein SufT [Mariprofundaceae bacterium]|nr:putative Fe-S cluster assembly protein SufT [Mariprofundaceae bacterium]
MMTSGAMITVSRSVDGVLIPMGTPVVVPEGSLVRVTQELGDFFTIGVNGNLVRIENHDADALGMHAKEKTAVGDSDLQQKTVDGPVNEDNIWDALKTCYDPEIPVNIVELGLIYNVHCVDTDEGGNAVEITMTLTAAGCGMGPFLIDDIRNKLLAVKNVTDVHVELVFDPPWDRAMMSELAKLQLGMF